MFNNERNIIYISEVGNVINIEESICNVYYNNTLLNKNLRFKQITVKEVVEGYTNYEILQEMKFEDIDDKYDNGIIILFKGIGDVILIRNKYYADDVQPKITFYKLLPYDRGYLDDNPKDNDGYSKCIIYKIDDFMEDKITI